MPIKNYNENDKRFEKIIPKPLPLLLKKFIGVTKDGVYNCMCPISGNVIDVLIDSKIKCDSVIDARVNCSLPSHDNEACPYKKNMT